LNDYSNTTDRLPSTAEVAPTRARYGVLAFLCSLSFVLYLDRVCIGQAAPAIQKELDLSNTEMGYALSAFVLAYGLFEVPTGRWGDRFGSRGVLARIVIWWSAFTALTGAAANLAMLVAVRFLFGAGEAGAYPNAARVLARWFPRSQRGAAQGLMLTSAQIGATISPRVAQWLIDDVGWRWTFVVFSAIGIVWAVAFYRWFRDDPARHPSVNEAERSLIAAGAPADAHGEHHAPIPWRAIGASPNVWLLGVVQTCSAAASYMYMMWYPSYLQQARGVSADDASWMSSLVLFGGAVGVLASGFVNDWLGRITSYHPGRFRVYGFLGTAGSAAVLAVSVQCESAWTTSAWAALAFALAISQQATFWNVTTEISGKNLGSIFGLMNSLGVPGAFVSTMFLGRFADWMAQQGYAGRAQWDPAFYIYAAVLLVGACCWLAVDARKKIPEGSA
jgi:ACS family glucarate transporter-like MFS transporter